MNTRKRKRGKSVILDSQRPKLETKEEAHNKKGESPTTFQDGWSNSISIYDVAEIIGRDSLQGRRFLILEDD